MDANSEMHQSMACSFIQRPRSSCIGPRSPYRLHHNQEGEIGDVWDDRSCYEANRVAMVCKLNSVGIAGIDVGHSMTCWILWEVL